MQQAIFIQHDDWVGPLKNLLKLQTQLSCKDEGFGTIPGEKQMLIEIILLGSNACRDVSKLFTFKNSAYIPAFTQNRKIPQMLHIYSQNSIYCTAFRCTRKNFLICENKYFHIQRTCTQNSSVLIGFGDQQHKGLSLKGAARDEYGSSERFIEVNIILYPKSSSS